MDDIERSPSGSPVYRHRVAERAFRPAEWGEHTEEVEAHLGSVFGEPATVFHEIVSDAIHLDVHVVQPAPGRDWWTLFTTGMSALPMTVPDGYDALRYAELVLKLPASWPVETIVTTPPQDVEPWYWPIRGLKDLARLPHDYETWLGMGHTVPNGDPPEPFAPNTGLCAWLLLPPLGVSDDARAHPLSDGSILNTYVVHGLHRDELELKLTQGMDALLDRFDSAKVREVLEPARPSSVARKRWGILGR